LLLQRQLSRGKFPYNLKYGAKLQVSWESEWYHCFAMFYAYDSKKRLFLKVHFDGYGSEHDTYICLKEQSHYIRSGSHKLEDTCPDTGRQDEGIEFDINTDNHYGIETGDENQYVKNLGFLIRPIENGDVNHLLPLEKDE
jgi:hypothetical protein